MSWMENVARWFGLDALRPHGPVDLDEVGVRRRLSDGRLEEVRWDQLEAVMIHTTADGPFGEDFFWVLFGPDCQGCVVPGEEAQALGLLPVLQGILPEMDHAQVIAASLCVEEDWFPVWRKGQAAPASAAETA